MYDLKTRGNEMTWIVAASSLNGYGTLISDIQVTTANGKQYDILQKIYPLGNFLCGGFSGSVKIGFMLVQSLKELLQVPPGYENHTWDPMKFVDYWSSIARDIFEHAPPEEKKAKASFLIVAASPYGLTGTYPPGQDSKIYMIRFCSPEFTPQIITKKLAIFSIGSGSKVKEFQRELRTKRKLGIFDRTLQADIHTSDGWAKALSFTLYRLVDMHPQAGISKHFHTITVRRGEIKGSFQNYDIYSPGGKVTQDHMPKVAKSYAEFESMLSQAGVNASAATC